MRILVGDESIQDRMVMQKTVGTFGECQTVDTAEVLLRVFQNTVSSKEERFQLVFIDSSLGQTEQLFNSIRAFEWEAGIPVNQQCLMAYTGTLVEWMGVSSLLGESCNSYVAKPFKRELIYKAMDSLGFEQARKETKVAEFDHLLLKHIKNDGEFVVIADDLSFFRTLNRGIGNTLKIKTKCVNYFSSPADAKQYISRPNKANTTIIVFIARTINGKLTTEHVSEIRKQHDRLHIIMLTRDSDDYSVAYLHDVDVDTVLTLPASLNNIFEKAANTLYPPTRLQELMQAARNVLKIKDHDAALRILDEALALKPYSPGVLLLKGDVLQQTGDMDGAIAAYEEAHLSSSLFIEPLKRLAEIYKNRSPELALAYLEKLDLLSPENPRRKVDIGTAKLEPEGIEVSRQYYDEGLDLASKESGRLVDELVNIISEVLRPKHPKVALSYIDALIDSKQGEYTLEDMETFNRRGVLLRQEGHWEKAIANYRKALTVAPDSDALQYNLMMAMMEGRDFSSAFIIARELMSRNTDLPRSSPGVAFNLASLFYKKNNPEQAMRLVNIALALDPGHEPSLKLQQKLTRQA